MTATKPKAQTRKPARRAPRRERKPVFGPAYGEWFMANVRREIAAGRVRTTVDENGERYAIN